MRCVAGFCCYDDALSSEEEEEEKTGWIQYDPPRFSLSFKAEGPFCSCLKPLKTIHPSITHSHQPPTSVHYVLLMLLPLRM